MDKGKIFVPEKTPRVRKPKMRDTAEREIRANMIGYKSRGCLDVTRVI